MKILFIACKYDYGKPELGHSFEYYNLYDSLVKMDGGRHQVDYFAFDEIGLKEGKEAMNKKLLDTVFVAKPDLCFFFLFGDQLMPETVQKITDAKISITFNWFADDKWRFENFTRYWAPRFDWVSTDQLTAVKKYHAMGYRNVLVCCWGCNQHVYQPLNLPKKYDVTFVGQPHGDRKKIVEKIKKAGIKIECFGRGWPNGKVSQEEMIRIFNQSKINLNPTKCSGTVDAKAIAKIFVDKKEGKPAKLYPPSAWAGNVRSLIDRQKNEIKGRNFEVPGCGSFLLSGYAEGLEHFYEIGKEIDCYRNDRELIAKIRYYLAHEEERERIAKAGYQRTMRDHTYEQRFREIFKATGLA